MSTLWDKGYSIDQTVADFTVGRDYLLDVPLVPADCAGTLAHVRALERAGILTAAEVDLVRSGLESALSEHREGRFTISKAQEDGHTALEQFLESRLGEVARKVHTGRSRNDQVLTSTRLYLRDFVFELAGSVAGLITTLLDRAAAYAAVPMPGRTHMQKAMLSSVGLWLGSYADSLLDDLAVVETALTLLNRSPLGSAAGYGISIPLDREYEAELLGFGAVQRNVLAASNSRGRTESYLLDALDQLCITQSKLAQDLILFSLPELGYVSLPKELCTGSSIMPQKQNPDGLELARATSATLSGYAVQVKNIVRSLPSGYNRDLQLTKEPVLRGCEAALQLTRVMQLSVEKLELHEDTLRSACTPELFATDEALDRVKRGVPFRDAYREVAADLASLSRRSNDPDGALSSRTSYGAAGNLKLDEAREELATVTERMTQRRSRAAAAIESLFGYPLALYNPLPE